MTTTKTDVKDSGREWGAALGFVLLRLWLSMRAIVAGIEKYSGTATSDAPVSIDGAVNTYGLTASTSQKTYALANHHGIPEALAGKFQAEPLLPGFALTFMDTYLGAILVVLGALLLVGLFTRITLFLMGLVYLALTVGLILIGQDAGVAWLGTHVLIVAFALSQSRYSGCLSISGLVGWCVKLVRKRG